LLEIIRYWGGPGPVGMNKTLPREYGLLYNGLVKQNVAFPEPLFLNEPMLAKVMFQPELDAIRNSGVRNSGPNPNNPQLSSSNPFTANPHTQLQHSITEMRRLRTDIAKKVMDSPAHPGRLGFTPDIPPLVMALDGAAKSIRGNPDLMNVEADPNAHALATDIRNELKVNDAIQESFRMGQTTGDISMLQMGVIEAYANTLNRDLFSNPITEPELNAIPILPPVVLQSGLPPPGASIGPPVVVPVPPLPLVTAPPIGIPPPRISATAMDPLPGPPILRIDTPPPPLIDAAAAAAADMALKEALMREQALQRQLEEQKRVEEQRRVQMERDFQLKMQREREEIIRQSQMAMPPPAPIPILPPPPPVVVVSDADRKALEMERMRFAEEKRRMEEEKARLVEQLRLKDLEVNFKAGEISNSKVNESTLFQVPGMYEEQRKKQREEIMRQRERDFEMRLQNARKMGLAEAQGENPFGPPKLNWSVSPERVKNTIEKVGGPVTTVGKEIVDNLLNRINKAEIDLQEEKRNLTLLDINVDSNKKEIDKLEKERDKMVDDATRMNMDNELVAAEVHNLKRNKEDLLHRLERRKLELLELKKESTESSDASEMRRRELGEMNNMMHRLINLKNLELYRNKSTYEQLEKDYQDSHAKRLRQWQLIRKKEPTSLTASALLSTSFMNPGSLEKSGLTESRLAKDPSYVTYYERESKRPSTTTVNLSKTLGKGEGSRFLADFNRDIDTLLNNVSVKRGNDLSSRSFSNY
jgi:hypothetical protein